MVASLRDQDRGASLTALRASLIAISEREQLGYVTDAMVSHRLRLRGLEASLLPVDEARFSAPLSTRAAALRTARAELPVARVLGLAVQSELLVYGATTDIVRGQPKPLLASFRVWLGIENVGSSPRTLSLPSVRGSVPLEVSRWYLEDGDGEPWSGQLDPGEKRSVLLIGYLGEQIPPGAGVLLSIDLDGVKLPLASPALSSWDAHADPFTPLPALGDHGARSAAPQNIK